MTSKGRRGNNPYRTGRVRKITGVRTVNGIKYDYRAFHPLAFEKNVYAVSIHRHGKPYLDRYSEVIQVLAPNLKTAVNKAFKAFKPSREMLS